MFIFPSGRVICPVGERVLISLTSFRSFHVGLPSWIAHFPRLGNLFSVNQGAPSPFPSLVFFSDGLLVLAALEVGRSGDRPIIVFFLGFSERIGRINRAKHLPFLRALLPDFFRCH